MALYDYQCSKCGVKKEVRMTFDEHATNKNSVSCECGYIMTQAVAILKFKLGGNGWADQDYGITETETKSNLDFESRVEDRYNNAVSKGEA